MVVNDIACGLDKRRALESIASKSGPTVRSVQDNLVGVSLSLTRISGMSMQIALVAELSTQSVDKALDGQRIGKDLLAQAKALRHLADRFDR